MKIVPKPYVHKVKAAFWHAAALQIFGNFELYTYNAAKRFSKDKKHIFRSLCRSLGALGPLLGPSWAALGPFWAPLGRSWGALGRSWAALRRS